MEALLSTTVNPPYAVSRASLTASAPPVFLLILSLIGYSVARKLLFHAARVSEPWSFGVILASLLCAAALYNVRYADFSKLLRPFVRGIGAIVLIQVLFDNLVPIPGVPNLLFPHVPGVSQENMLLFRWGGLIGVVAGIIAMWRPSFLLPMFFYYVSFRIWIGHADGVPVVDTDYLSMLDTAEFALIGGCLIALLTSPWLTERFPALRGALGTGDLADLRNKGCALVWSCAVGAHLGNYFYSGIAKLVVGGSAPLTWLFHNPTQTSIVIGLERGDSPIVLMPWAVQLVWNAISAHALLFNAFVLGAQLLAPLAPITVGTLIVFTFMFDLLHLGVYFTLGALFFFWIAVNTFIWISAGRMKKGEFTPAMKLTCFLTVLFGHYAFYTNHLGWLDGAKLASPTFYVMTKDGRELRVPSNYFGISSYTISQGGTYIPDNHFSFRIGGNNLNREAWHDATSCGPAIMAHQDTGTSRQAIAALIVNTDALMRQYPVLKNQNLYYLYPHHTVPNPFQFREFNALKISDIVGYKYVVDSVCLGMKDGHLQRDVRKHWEMPVMVH